MSLKILILGASGMIGHNLYNEMINQTPPLNVYFLTSKSKNSLKNFNIFHLNKGYFEIKYFDLQNLMKILTTLRPDFVINCCGITKQKCIKENTLNIQKINIDLPRFLSDHSKILNYKLILLSSDCVFSGKKGNYKITDKKDADDLYGLSKSNSEFMNSSTLILRKSTIGLELNDKHGLLEWFLSQNGIIKGYKNAIFNGLTTRELAKIIIFIINKHSHLTGLYHLGSEDINKYDLLIKILNLIKNFKKNIIIEPYNDFYCNRSLDCSKFYNITKYKKPNWDEMLKELKIEIVKKYYENS